MLNYQISRKTLFFPCGRNNFFPSFRQETALSCVNVLRSFSSPYSGRKPRAGIRWTCRRVPALQTRTGDNFRVQSLTGDMTSISPHHFECSAPIREGLFNDSWF